MLYTFCYLLNCAILAYFVGQYGVRRDWPLLDSCVVSIVFIIPATVLYLGVPL